jgi:HEAT repeat protein
MKPYKGLRPYEEQDKDNFFGRDAEKRILVNKILTNKLTLLFAASGVGKSSLLQAAVIPYLKAPIGKNLDVVYHNNWFADPSADLKQTLIDYRKEKKTPNHSLALSEFLKFYTVFTSEPLIIILDQFEEFFNYQRHSKHFKPFIEQLTAAILDQDIATVFVISMREDFALELNAFKPDLPTLLFNNFYRLEKLTREKAEQAITTPLDYFGFSYEPSLLEMLLHDLSRREQFERADFSKADFIEAPDFIEPPHLQIVCAQLWQAEQNNPIQQISKATYENKGKALGFLSIYLETRIQQLSPADKKIASLAFNYLVNQHGTKMAYPVRELAQLLKVEEPLLANTLDKLEQARILRKQARQNVMWYELYHDMFAKSVYNWNVDYIDKQSFCLHLNPNNEISDDIELYRGIRQAHYVCETGYYRADIEPDKLFTHEIIPKIDKLNLELLGFLPLAKRVVAYYDDGEIIKSRDLANAAISTYDITLSKRLIDTLAGFRSVKSHHTLQERLQSETNTHLKQQIIATLGKTQAPFEITALLRPFLKDEDSSVRSAALGLAQLGAIEAVTPLIELLKDNNKDVRRSAVQGLAQLNATEAIKPLIELLKDTDLYVHWNTMEALGQLGATEVIKPFIETLKDKYSSPSDKHYAAKALGQLGATEAIKPLIELPKGTDSYFVADILEQLGATETATKRLIELLEDTDPNVRSEASKILGKLGTTEAIGRLIELLKDSNQEVRSTAASTLGRLGAVEAVEKLIDLLEDSSENVRRSAASTLGQLGAVEAVEKLIDLLEDSSPKVRSSAASTLGKLGAVEPLIRLFKDTDSDVCSSAAMALAKLDATEAITPLIELLKDTKSYVRSNAVKGLAQLGATEAIKPLLELFKDTNKEVRNNTALALAQIGTTEVVKPLIELFGDTDWQIRHSAVLVLAQLGITEAIPPLIEFLKDTDRQVRSSAVEALGQLGTTEAVKPLIKLLKDTDEDVLRSAVEALAQLGATEAVTPLIELLKDTDVRRSAVEALAQLGATEAIKPLLELLKDAESNIRNYTAFEVKNTLNNAGVALAQLGATEAVKPLIELLKDTKLYIRSDAMKGLVQLGTTDEVIKSLIELLKDTRSFVRSSAVNVLAQLGSTDAVTPLIGRLKDTDKDVRYKAALGLAHLNSTEAVTPLIELLKDTNKNVRWNAVSALSQLDTDNDEVSRILAKELATLEKESRHQSAYQRKDVAQKLSKLFLKQSVTLLMSLLTDKHLGVKKQAIISLGQIGKKQPELLRPALSQLHLLLEDSNIHIRREVVKTFGKIIPQLPDEKEIWLARFADIAKNQQQIFPVRTAALKILAKLGTNKAVQLILKMVQPEQIEQESSSFMLAVFQTLGDIRSEVALDFLDEQLKALTERKQMWRKQRDTEQTEPLNSWQYCQWETELGYAIAQIDPDSTGIKLLSHDIAEVRKGAWLAMGRIGNVQIIKGLVVKHHESQPYEAHFRHAAFRAIDKILITIEVKGNKQDLEVLQALLPNIEHVGIRDRVEWTILCLVQRHDKINSHSEAIEPPSSKKL